MTARRLRVVQVGFHSDRQRRDPRALLAAWPTLHGVASAVARTGVALVVVQAAHRAEMIVRDGVDYRFLPGRRRIVEQVVSLAPDVVHVHGFIAPLAVRHLSRAMRGVPVLVQDHSTVEPRGWRQLAWRWAYQSIVGVAFTAREQAEPFIAAGAFRAAIQRFGVVEGSSTFTPGDQEASRRATGMFGNPCLLWTGGLDSNKDPLTALTAFEQAAPQLPDARLWCCFGVAPLLAEVTRRIAESPLLRERATLLGQRPHDEMESRLRAADFFVQTSHREGSGYSLIESLACGTTPLVSDIAPFRRMVGACGSLTPVGDARALGDAIVAWARRDRLALRRAARARFEQELTFDVIGRELHSVYQQLAATR